MEFKEIIKNQRAALNLTLEDIARHVGVSAATVSRWENGSIENVRRDKIAKLSEILKVSPAYLMGWDDRVEFETTISDLKNDIKFVLSGSDSASKSTPECERIKDPDIYRIERAKRRMSELEWARQMKVIEASFGDYFSDDYVDEDTDE